MKQLILVCFSGLSFGSFAQETHDNCNQSSSRPIVIDYPAIQLTPLSADSDVNRKANHVAQAVALTSMRMAETSERIPIPEETRTINAVTAVAIPVRSNFKSTVKRVEAVESNQNKPPYPSNINNIEGVATKLSSEYSIVK